MGKQMIIAQISDCHVTRPGQLVFGQVDTCSMLADAVEAILRLPMKPALVLVTGDLVESGSPEEYRTFRKITAPLAAMIFPVAGNHDNREALIDAFDLRSVTNIDAEFVQYTIEGLPFRIVVIDTTTPGSVDGNLCERRLTWIDARLRESKRPTLLALHHPPFPAGVSWMEPKDPDWALGLAAITANHRHIVRIVCGHVHRQMFLSWNGFFATSAPSTAHQVCPDFRAHSEVCLNLEAPGLLLHQWLGAQLVTYGVGISGMAERIQI